MVWTVVCSGRSGDSGHPWGVQNLDAWGTLDVTSGLDACVNFERVGASRIWTVGVCMELKTVEYDVRLVCSS